MALIISEETHLSTFKYTEKKRTLLTPAPEKGKLSILFFFRSISTFPFCEGQFQSCFAPSSVDGNVALPFISCLCTIYVQTYLLK